MVVGTPGGSRIITAVLHTIINVIDYGMNVQEAVDAPRFHQQWLPEATNVETFALSPDTRKMLDRDGPQVRPRRNRPTTWRRSSSARRRSAASRSARTATTARTIRDATPGSRGGIEEEKARSCNAEADPDRCSRKAAGNSNEAAACLLAAEWRDQHDGKSRLEHFQ